MGAALHLRHGDGHAAEQELMEAVHKEVCNNKTLLIATRTKKMRKGALIK